MHILDYFESIPDTEEGKIMEFLHQIISTYPGIAPKVHFNTPFYTRNKWMVYVSRQKKGGVEICFVYANLFEQHRELLDFKKRKQVGGIMYNRVEEIDVEQIDLLMQQALRVDEVLISKRKRK